MSVTQYNVTGAIQGFSAGVELAGLTPTIVAGKQIDMKDPGLNPFMVLVHHTQKMPAVNALSYIYHDDQRIKRKAVVATAAASGATSIVVDDASAFAPWDAFYCPEKEYRGVVVSVVYGTNTLTVSPNSDAGGASALSVGDVLLNLGKQLTEGTDITGMTNTMPEAFTNYVENFMRVVAITRHGEKLANYYKQPHVKRLWDQATHAFNTDMDSKLMFNGKPRLVTAATLATAASGTFSLPTDNGGYVGMTQGFWYWHRNNASAEKKIFQDAMTEFETFDALEQAFDEKGGTDHKVMLLGKQYRTAIMKWMIGRTRYNITGDGKELPLGLKATRIEIASGVVDLVRYWPFEPQGANGLHRFAIIDKGRIGYVPYAGMDTFIERDLPTTAQRRIDYIGACIGTVFHTPDAHVTGEIRTFTV